MVRTTVEVGGGVHADVANARSRIFENGQRRRCPGQRRRGKKRAFAGERKACLDLGHDFRIHVGGKSENDGLQGKLRGENGIIVLQPRKDGWIDAAPAGP